MASDALAAPEEAPSRRWAVRHRWPTALGLAAAATQLAFGPDAETLATVIAVAVLCYLGAAALDRRWVGWAGCLAFPAVLVTSQVVGVTWWVVGSAVAVVLLVVGLATRAPRPPLTAQSLALLGYGVVAVTALFLSPRTGLVVAGFALASHGIWDVIHYRRNQVVNRSLAEFCIVLDVPLGVAAILVALAG
ncbi:hypothetical protein O7635_24885 [Asanoa sp. WMMD1127]|uniref:hypothetical protein n=1 Tax=Asanoa sp. WMMD1127 TaxID=3016107 RepID=UPI0024176DB3|nr:hypothetical protein [Asanoa sp. WMMD1127]MDG4825096.1 hypothetical protein [Asanoa sp. WMMD1127]